VKQNEPLTSSVRPKEIILTFGEFYIKTTWITEVNHCLNMQLCNFLKKNYGVFLTDITDHTPLPHRILLHRFYIKNYLDYESQPLFRYGTIQLLEEKLQSFPNRNNRSYLFTIEILKLSVRLLSFIVVI